MRDERLTMIGKVAADVGDEVLLKGCDLAGGPIMTVEEVPSGEPGERPLYGYLTCVWFDRELHLQRAVFPASMLRAARAWDGKEGR